ncbi:MAG: Dabb family protein [Planctomycetota bacterium]|jgi:hypothetical protein
MPFPLLSMVLAAACVAAEPAPRTTPVLRHIVLYKFKDTTTPAQIDEVSAAFKALPGKIPGIVGFEAGTNVSPEGKSEGFTHAFVVSFATEKDRDAYIVHPAHQDFVKIVKDRREKVIVVDFWVK